MLEESSIVMKNNKIMISATEIKQTHRSLWFSLKVITVKKQFINYTCVVDENGPKTMLFENHILLCINLTLSIFKYFHFYQYSPLWILWRIRNYEIMLTVQLAHVILPVVSQYYRGWAWKSGRPMAKMQIKYFILLLPD